MKKTILSLGIICLGALTLAGCGNQNKVPQKTAAPKTEQKVKKDTANESKTESDTQTSDSDSVESGVATASSTTTPNKQAENDPQVTPQQLGTMVAFLQNPDWFKEYLKDGTMYYGTNNPKLVVGGDEVAGYDFVSANGDPTSYIYYKKDGDTVTIKDVEPHGSQCVADAGYTTRTVSYHNLLQDYYQSQGQKDEVNNDASQLKSWASVNQAVYQSQN
ncbi:hypothetical protein A3O11_04670 [Ligilactobacillus aviarius]|uniref:Lreu_0056 family protein n=1 Tax=Ligilactobacillus aviarius TaxID=1606 RepID=UPI0007D8F95E|nr:hypothetical protein [Ligilactobacillus aviarius]OAQ02034.1 hypothetical protein A3O10_07575 [Ligilactobacillus aviarius]OAQ04857.1 hypothetical protein A3O11_04670 [Ligilactobacillus aviarius]OAS80460.1 hypothetical protein A3O18_04195 [Ligilactobacillus aviarius]PEG70365.1 hypothetical protein A3P04_06775 [Ligilactobacillus aviarius]PEG74005.1 hypothetical protein A3O82_03205 [Ligilactobacillus aviarius]